ncbi:MULTISPECIES: hypothetical protein [unclassified Pseudoxanthomonas]|uniref:hypothetical protein n=1 Tax=unclassified Pseudoxanthomonas TaxID=2645906 RepID=UPI001622D8F5|nr:MULTISPECIES: hypothetical protein [unclassified Pseudoxanthomonas]MBB3277426.1 hypothetical protein [Pseudoxanthomonas sp. OG2]MBV7474099.1 hypothetical protein [Pseudoxanthomonas sp. PXM05]
MAICKACGIEKANFMSDLCGNCMDKRVTPSPSVQSFSAPAQSPPAAQSFAQEKGSVSACLVLGVVFLLIGLYFLIDPTTNSSSPYGSIDLPKVANIHKLTLGQTFSIMGAVFLAAGLRPRR